MVAENRTNDDALEGKDVAATQGFAALCSSGITGFDRQSDSAAAGSGTGTRYRARSVRNLSGFFIDIHHEQQLLREHDVIIFQHPLYTYSCPALLKEWLDRVLSRGFANGVDGNALEGKYWRSVVTTGEPESAFRHQGLNRYSLNDIMRPFELTAQMCRMHWMPPMIVYWARRQSPELMKNYARAYGDWLAAPLPNGGV